MTSGGVKLVDWVKVILLQFFFFKKSKPSFFLLDGCTEVWDTIRLLDFIANF